MTKKTAARTISTTDREEYPEVPALKQIRITRHKIWKDDKGKGEGAFHQSPGQWGTGGGEGTSNFHVDQVWEMTLS